MQEELAPQGKWLAAAPASCPVGVCVRLRRSRQRLALRRCRICASQKTLARHRAQVHHSCQHLRTEYAPSRTSTSASAWDTRRCRPPEICGPGTIAVCRVTAYRAAPALRTRLASCKALLVVAPSADPQIQGGCGLDERGASRWATQTCWGQRSERSCHRQPQAPHSSARSSC